MAQCATPRLRFQSHRLRTQPPTRPDLGLEAVLPEATIMQTLREEGGLWRSITYTPWVTFWTFFWQALSPDRSCRSALKRLSAWMGLRGRKLDVEDTGPYCKARARLPESALKRLMRLLGLTSHRRAPEDWRWCSRRVKVVDGSTAIMADTPANQEAYPQLASQGPGLGFPILRFVAIFCLATGSVLEVAMGKYQGKQTGENALFRSLWDDAFEPDDVALGDRYYCSYFDIAMLKRRGVDGVFRLHQRRPCDFRRGRRLGKEDRIVEWTRPKRPDWMGEDVYDTIPETMEIRQVRIHAGKPGFRTRVLDLSTTLLDPEIYTRSDLGLLYRQRWHAELDLRSIKVVLGMDMLRCKTPEMVRKEIWMTLLGYNVIRALMAEASREHGRDPRHVSFKGALQTLQEFAAGLREGTPEQRRWLWTILLSSIADDAVGYRPDRVEPRARKRRPKQYPLLTVPRRQAQAAMSKAG
jgi:putative transposase